MSLTYSALPSPSRKDDVEPAPKKFPLPAKWSSEREPALVWSKIQDLVWPTEEERNGGEAT